MRRARCGLQLVIIGYGYIGLSHVWYGGMNLLSKGREYDSLMRIVSPEIATELLEMWMNND